MSTVLKQTISKLPVHAIAKRSLGQTRRLALSTTRIAGEQAQHQSQHENASTALMAAGSTLVLLTAYQSSTSHSDRNSKVSACDSVFSYSFAPSSHSNVEGKKNNFPYQIHEVLGEGAFGTVYRAVRKSDNSNTSAIALKAVPRQSAMEHETYQREKDALTILSEPGHANVCQLYDSHEDPNATHSYLALELVEGEEVLDRLIDEGVFSEQEASHFMSQLADALSYIHSKGLVHGDLKPENLMIHQTLQQREQQLKVVDFGCSVSTEECAKVGPSPSSSGRTVAYSPPEALLDEVNTKPITPAYDMYATGCILYCLLTGTHPFDPHGDATNEEIAESIRLSAKDPKQYLDEAVFGPDRVHGLSDDVVDVMRKLLEPDPTRRMTTTQLQNHKWLSK